MWPQALQMTRDECRGILRRLELESYSQVISVFRAQGGLSEAKAKLLEELRGIFHISTERHRAEARRVANDEQLATIAEAISGPNTWQEWSREGRRPYPLLPRVAPHTALALIANNVAEETANENQKLPYPAETGEAIKEEQQQIEKQRPSEIVERNNHVVTSDPFKIPEIPSGTGKKNLKRNIHDQNQNQNVSGVGSGKKRAISENSPQKNHQHSAANRQQYPHITANSPQVNNNITASTNHEQKSKQQQQAAAAAAAQHQHLQKQRYFHHQQQLTKQKMAKKAAAAAAAGSASKRQATPAKSGRRAQQKLLLEQHQQQQQQQQQQMSLKQIGEPQSQNIPHSGSMHIDLTSSQPLAANSVLTQQQNDLQFLTYATQNVPPQQILMDEQQSAAQTQIHILPANQPPSGTSLITPATPSLLPSPTTPQIAASKRDVSKNLNKLQQMQQNQHQPVPISFPSGTPSVISSHDMQSNIGTIITSQSPAVKSSTEKSLISTTPVQKYIVEERQPIISTAPGSIVSLQSSPNPSSANAGSTSHIIQVSNAGGQTSQIMALPQFSAAATKLRAVNTTLIAPGSKISPTSNKKITTITSPLSPINAGALHELANVASTQSQVLHIVETTQGGSSNPTNSTSFASSLQTPPAVIQIQSGTTGVSAVSTPSDVVPVAPAPAPTSQSKVLTTTILPLVLSGTGGGVSVGGNSTSSSGSSPSISNAPIIIGSTCSTAGSSTTTSTTTTAATATTFIKNLPSTVVLNTNTNTLTPVTVTGTIFSTLGAGATVFRKPQNIIKTSVATAAVTSTSKCTTAVSGAPHIISNVKLTPMNVSTTNAVVTPLCSANSTFKNVLPTTSGMMRTSVKICQSPNGKVVIQPAGLMDGSKVKLNTSTLSHKILASSVTNSATATSVAGGTGGQRIAIQKVQIIPAPLGSPAAGTTTIQAAGTTALGSKTTTLTGKSNMIFMPSSATANVRPVTLSKMGNNILLKSTACAQLASSPDGNSGAKTNIVVLGPSSSIQTQNTNPNPSTSTSTLKDTLSQNKIEMNSSASSFMNEDAPLDILNMPIVMDPGVGVASGGGDTVTVLSGGNILDSNAAANTTTTTPIIVEQGNSTHLPLSSATQQTVILGATDWEMELDQAITTAAHNNNTTIQYQKSSTSNTKQKRSISTSSSSNSSSSLCVTANKMKRINSDLISIELKSNRPTTLSSHVKSLPSSNNNSTNNIIVVDSFDDVIVEEHEDDLTSTCSTNVEQTSTETAKNRIHDDDQPKILDMQIYQQHDGGVDGGKSQITIVADNNEGPATNVSENRQRKIQSNVMRSQPQQQPEQRQRQQHMECEVDAGFDETIVSEIDENTAIEYIEEDGALVTSSSSSLLPTVTSQSNSKESSTEAVILTKALSSGVSTTTIKSSLNTSNIGAKPSKEHPTDAMETTVNNSNTQLQQLQPETQANNSGSSTQVEP